MGYMNELYGDLITNAVDKYSTKFQTSNEYIRIAEAYDEIFHEITKELSKENASKLYELDCQNNLIQILCEENMYEAGLMDGIEIAMKFSKLINNTGSGNSLIKTSMSCDKREVVNLGEVRE